MLAQTAAGQDERRGTSRQLPGRRAPGVPSAEKARMTDQSVARRRSTSAAAAPRRPVRRQAQSQAAPVCSAPGKEPGACVCRRRCMRARVARAACAPTCCTCCMCAAHLTAGAAVCDAHNMHVAVPAARLLLPLRLELVAQPGAAKFVLHLNGQQCGSSSSGRAAGGGSGGVACAAALALRRRLPHRAVDASQVCEVGRSKRAACAWQHGGGGGRRAAAGRQRGRICRHAAQAAGQRSRAALACSWLCKL